MQTCDQSLMTLFKQNIITYEEALRQCSNPDDFALRVSGISATSDSSWDSFEGGKDETQTPGGGQKAKTNPGMRAPSAPPPAAGRPGPAAGTKPAAAAPAAKPAAGAPAADDDFQIERF
jgi:twitching motility protein PilT